MIKLLWIPFIILVLSVFEIGNVKNSGNLEIYILDVGQGDSMLIKTPNNQIGLVDVGVHSNIIPELGKELDFYTKKIDFIILTHPDADHIEGLIELVNRFEIETVFVNETNKTNNLIEQIKKDLQNNSISNYALNDQNDFIIDNVKFDILWPKKDLDISKIENPNNASISILISYENFNMITMGDLEAKEEILAVQDLNIDIDILKISHHGSNTSTSQFLLDMTKPENAIISAGKDNRYGHPTSKVVNLLGLNNIKVYRTDIAGSIKIIVNDDGSFEFATSSP